MLAHVKPARRDATYDDVLAAPEHVVAEIIDGDLYTSPRPASPHANAHSMLGVAIGGPFHGPPGSGGHPGGWWVLDEPELHFGRDVLVPDLAAWRRERMPVLGNVPYFTLAPDWLCEIASPSTAALDRGRKMRIYAREGVEHLWLVEPLGQTLEVYRLQRVASAAPSQSQPSRPLHEPAPAARNAWLLVETHVAPKRLRVPPFDAVEVDLERCWPEDSDGWG